MSGGAGSEKTSTSEVFDYIVDVSDSPAFNLMEFKRSLLNIRHYLMPILNDLHKEFKKRHKGHSVDKDKALEIKSRFKQIATELYTLIYPHKQLILGNTDKKFTEIIYLLDTILIGLVPFVTDPQIITTIFNYLMYETGKYEDSKFSEYEQIITNGLSELSKTSGLMTKEDKEKFVNVFKTFMNMHVEQQSNIIDYFAGLALDKDLIKYIENFRRTNTVEKMNIIEQYCIDIVFSIKTTEEDKKRLLHQFDLVSSRIDKDQKYPKLLTAMRFIYYCIVRKTIGAEHFDSEMLQLERFLDNDIYKTGRDEHDEHRNTHEEAFAFVTNMNLLLSLDTTLYDGSTVTDITKAKALGTTALNTIYNLIPHPKKIDIKKWYTPDQAIYIFFNLASKDPVKKNILDRLYASLDTAFNTAIAARRAATNSANSVIKAGQNAKMKALEEARAKFAETIAKRTTELAAEETAAAAAAAAAAAQAETNRAAAREKAETNRAAERKKAKANRNTAEAEAVAKGAEVLESIRAEWVGVNEKPAAAIQSAKITVIDHFHTFAPLNIGPLINDIIESSRITMGAVQLRKDTYDALFSHGYGLEILVAGYLEVQGSKPMNTGVLDLLARYLGILPTFIHRICPGAGTIRDAVGKCADKIQRLMEELPIFVPSVFYNKPVWDDIMWGKISGEEDINAVKDAVACLCMGDTSVTIDWFTQAIYPFIEVRCSNVCNIKLDIRRTGDIYLDFTKEELKDFCQGKSVPHISIHVPKFGVKKEFTKGAFHFSFNKTVVGGKPIPYFRRYIFNGRFFQPEPMKMIPTGKLPVEDNTHGMPADVISAVDDCFKYFSCLFSPEASAELISRRGGAVRRTRKIRKSKYGKTRSAKSNKGKNPGINVTASSPSLLGHSKCKRKSTLRLRRRNPYRSR